MATEGFFNGLLGGVVAGSGNPETPPPALNSMRVVLTTAIAFSLAFTLLGSIRLEGQGLFGDELHQATAVFAFGPNLPEIIEGLHVGGIPVLNMPYSGAIKSAAFAAYLQFPGQEFNAVSWRRFGILLSTAGIISFCLITGRWVQMSVLVPFLLLLVTDVMVILGSRHDWGPIALALLLRLTLLALWLRGELLETPPPHNSFLLGLVLGFSIFEKLSNVVLVAVLPVLFGLSPGRRSLRHALALALGLGLGSLPLAAVNVYTYIRDGSLISLAPGMVRNFSTRIDFASYLLSYLEIGAGEAVQKFILGVGTNPFLVAAERVLIGGLVTMAAVSALCWWRRQPLLRASGIMLISYGTIAVALFAIPRTTWVHHWVIGTPFQYLAIALAALGIWRVAAESATNASRVWSGCFSALLAILLVARLLGIFSVVESLQRGDSAKRWNPSLTRFGELMSEHTDNAMVVTAGWGLAPQAYCFSGGARNFVHDLFWTYERPAEISNRLEATNRSVLFVARPEWRSLIRNTRGTRMWKDLDSIESWAPGWREVGVGGELGQLESITVRKFVRLSHR